MSNRNETTEARKVPPPPPPLKSIGTFLYISSRFILL